MSESLSKSEVLLICVTAAAIEGKPLNTGRIAVLSNLLTGNSDSQNAVEMRMREWRKKARALLDRENNGEASTPSSAAPSPKKRGKTAAKSTTGATKNGVISGRISKPNARAKTAKAEDVKKEKPVKKEPVEEDMSDVCEGKEEEAEEAV